MKILSLKYIKTITPEGCSSGTGYSEPDLYEVVTDTKTYFTYIDIWYRVYTKRDAKKIIREKFEGYIENLEEVEDMFIKILKDRKIL